MTESEANAPESSRSEEFEWRVEADGDTTRMTLLGPLTEASDLTPLLERAGPHVRLDLEGVHRINSSGIREWIPFIERLSVDREVVLERCSVAIVEQLNMLANMAGQARVASVMLPYFCEQCGREEASLLDLESADEPVIAERISCSSCDGHMVFDDIAETYLSFRRQD